MKSTDPDYIINRLRKLNAGGKYYRSDVVLLERFEKQLMKKGYTKGELKRLSPNYYKG